MKMFFKLFNKSNKNKSQNAFQPLNYNNFMFNGEKNFKNLNLPYTIDIDYYGMANRAWNLYLTTDITKICVDRLAQFTIGDGLKLQYEPDKLILKELYNIDINSKFIKIVESKWNIFANSKYISNNKQDDIHNLANTIMINAILCGDCLVIKRVVDGIVNYQIIDGRNVVGGIPENNNTIIDGVEINKNNEHTAYHIRDKNGLSTRIKARDSFGNLQAWLVYANKSRISQVRGVSSICSIIQKLSQLSEYSENEVTASEVNSKLAVILEHSDNSDGKNPFVGRSLSSKEQSTNNSLSEEAKNNALKLSNGLFIDLGSGKKLNSFDTKRPNVNFEAFLDANAKYIFASQSIPYEIAKMLFSNNFSASRAALKMFELTLKVTRKNIIVDGIYKPAFKDFLLMEILKNNLNIQNFENLQNNQIDINALYKCRFISPPIPHIDPLKEVHAVTEKIKNNLCTIEEGMEELGNSTDFDTTMERIKTEQNLMNKLAIINKNKA